LARGGSLTRSSNIRPRWDGRFSCKRPPTVPMAAAPRSPLEPPRIMQSSVCGAHSRAQGCTRTASRAAHLGPIPARTQARRARTVGAPFATSVALGGAIVSVEDGPRSPRIGSPPGVAALVVTLEGSGVTFPPVRFVNLCGS
jgi:hypothetical protein